MRKGANTLFRILFFTPANPDFARRPAICAAHGVGFLMRQDSVKGANIAADAACAEIWTTAGRHRGIQNDARWPTHRGWHWRHAASSRMREDSVNGWTADRYCCLGWSRDGPRTLGRLGRVFPSHRPEHVVLEGLWDAWDALFRLTRIARARAHMAWLELETSVPSVPTSRICDARRPSQTRRTAARPGPPSSPRGRGYAASASAICEHARPFEASHRWTLTAVVRVHVRKKTPKGSSYREPRAFSGGMLTHPPPTRGRSRGKEPAARGQGSSVSGALGAGIAKSERKSCVFGPCLGRLGRMFQTLAHRARACARYGPGVRNTRPKRPNRPKSGGALHPPMARTCISPSLVMRYGVMPDTTARSRVFRIGQFGINPPANTGACTVT
jgi:hypothetical protein